jgi:hypothetical protein
MWFGIRKVIKLPFVISAVPLALVVVVGGYLSYRYNMILKDNRDLVVHTQEVISAMSMRSAPLRMPRQGREDTSSGDKIPRTVRARRRNQS